MDSYETGRSNLIKALEFLQENDSSYNWKDILYDLDNGYLPLYMAEGECIDALIRWRNQSKTPKGKKEIQTVLDGFWK